MPSDLASKLRQWRAAGPPTPRARPARRTIDEIVPGRYERTPHGECFVVEWHYPADCVHGTVPLAQALSLSERTRHLLTRGKATGDLDSTRALFLDTETTGL